MQGLTPERWRIVVGDCRNAMRELDDVSVDAVVCDPPYELGFMGKSWDAAGVAYDARVWREALRVLKPGGHLLAFGGSRTYHRLACAVEDAGFEIRDQIMWLYGSGFPKSLDVGKAFDRAAGVEREVVGVNRAAVRNKERSTTWTGDVWGDNGASITAPATDLARQWDGWGTALKPAHEPIVVARKPLDGTVAANVERWGTGAINVEGCRVGTGVESWPSSRSYAPGQLQPGGHGVTQQTGPPPPGRWPANVCHDGSAEVLAGMPETASGQLKAQHINRTRVATYGTPTQGAGAAVYGNDTGSAARFFYCAKASRAERELGLEGGGESTSLAAAVKALSDRRSRHLDERRNHHPTVKPIALMRWLVRLVTPPGGLVLDPFAGSGTTGIAALREGFRFLGVEQDAEYARIARHRIAASVGMVLDDEPLEAPANGNGRAQQMGLFSANT